MVNHSAARFPPTTLGPRHARPAQPRMSAARRAVWQALLAAGEAVTVATLSQRLGQHPNTIREHLDALVAGDRVARTRSQPSGRGRPAWLYRAVEAAATGNRGGFGGPSSGGRGGAGGAADPSADRASDQESDLGPAPAGGDGYGPDGRDDYGGDDYGSDYYGSDDYGADDYGDGGEYAALALALIEEVGRSNPDPRAVARQAGERWGRTLADRRPRSGAPAGCAVPRNETAAGSRGVRTDCAGQRPSDAVLDMLAELRFEPQPAPARPGVVRLTTCPLLDAARRNPDLVCQVHLGIVRGALERCGGDPDGAVLEPFAEPGACLLTLADRR